MSSQEETKINHSPDPSTTNVDDKVLYEETATSDPISKSEALASVASDSDEEGEAIRKNPFLDPDVAEHWAGVYEKARYECRAQFDPAFTWTEEEEKKLVRRLDWHVCLWAVRTSYSSSWIYLFLTSQKCVMFFGLQVDRGNLVQAVSDNLLNDLKLTTNGNKIYHYTVAYINANWPQTTTTETTSSCSPSS